MKKKTKAKILTLAIIGTLGLSGCQAKKKTDITHILQSTTVHKDQIVSVKETPIKDSKKKDIKDVEITLNLRNISKTIIYEESLQTINKALYSLESILGDSINDYTFKINSSVLDIYGNEQKVRVLDLKIKNESVSKIKFENFDYKNLDKISEVKKYKILLDEEKSVTEPNPKNTASQS